MVSQKQFLAVDLGSSTLKLGLMQADASGGLTLLDYVLRDLGLDPNKEQEKFPFLVEALQAVVKERKYASCPVYCSISGQFVFTRFVRLPPVAPDQISQMIGFEAQQNVPFPMNEVVWDYQLLGGKNAKDVEAVIVAVKSELVEQANSALQLCRLDMEKVDVAPLAIVNAYKYNYPESDACNLIVDIGAKCSNLVFIEGKKIFCRSIPIGGHLISQNVSNEFQEPYVAAEMLKKGKGFVGLGGAYTDPDDPSAARISKISRSVFSRLHAEISRSISFYRNQQNGSAPQKIILAGGASAMPYTDLFFREKLNVPVEFFNPLKNVRLSPGIKLSELVNDAYLLGEVVGLGTRRLEGVPAEINLVPASVAKKRTEKNRIPYLAASFLVWILMFVLLVGAGYMNWMHLSDEEGVLESDVNRKNELSRQIEKNNKILDRNLLRAQVVQRVLHQRDFWPQLLSVVMQNTALSREIWITQMEVTSDGVGARPVPPAGPRVPKKTGIPPKSATTTQLVIHGFFEVPDNGNGAAQSDELLTGFVSRLQNCGYFEPGKIELVDRDVYDPDQIARKFTVRAVIKDDKTPDMEP